MKLANLGALLLVAVCLLVTIESKPVENEEIGEEDEQISREKLLQHGPVVPASIVYDDVTNKLNSPNQADKEEARGVLESLLSQMKGTTDQYGKITWHGFQYVVNMGKVGTSLRAYNEAIGSKLWNSIREFFIRLFALFGVKINDEIDENDHLNKDSLLFDIATSIQVIRRLEYTVREKRDLLHRIEHAQNSKVTERVFNQIKQATNSEAEYLEDLRRHVKRQEERLKKFEHHENQRY